MINMIRRREMAYVFVFLGSLFVYSDVFAQACKGGSSEMQDEVFSQTSYVFDKPEVVSYNIGDMVRTRLSFGVRGNDVSNQDVSAIMFVLDKSPSMSWSASDCGSYCYIPPTKITLAKNALVDLVDQIARSKSGSLAGLVSFDSSAYGTLESNFTNDYIGLKNRINGVQIGNGTRLEGGLSAATDIFRTSADSLKNYGVKGKYIVLISDGKNDPSTTSAVEKVSIDGIASDITVFTIGIGNRSYLDQGKLQRIAAGGKGNGEYFYLSDFTQLQGKLNEIMTKITTPFSIRNVSVLLKKSSASQIALMNSSGEYVSQMQYNVPGVLKKGDAVSFPVEYKALYGGALIPLNNPEILIEYMGDETGSVCTLSRSVPILNVTILGQCLGAVPKNSTPCGSENIFENKDNTAVNMCAGGGCEHTCNTCYVASSDGSACVSQKNTHEAQCGTANGGSVCGLRQDGMCTSGYAVGTRLEDNVWKWNCSVACSMSVHASVACSAEQNCGWVEVAP